MWDYKAVRAECSILHTPYNNIKFIRNHLVLLSFIIGAAPSALNLLLLSSFI